MQTTKTKELNDLKSLNTLISDFLDGQGFNSKFIEKPLKKSLHVLNTIGTYVEKSKLNPNLITDYVDTTALEYVCGRKAADESRRILLVKLLIKLGANHSGGLHRPLIVAANRGDLEIIKTLIEHGADINQSGSTDGKVKITALTAATNKQHLDVVEYFLNQGACIYHKECPFSPVRIAIQDNMEEYFNVLLKYIDKKDFINLYGELEGLDYRGKLAKKYIQFLLNLPERRDGYLLAYALIKNDFDLLDKIIQLNGNDPDKLYEIFLTTGEYGSRSFLHIASEAKNGASIITYFINKYHPNVFVYSIENNIEMTAFAMTVKENNLESMKAMLTGLNHEEKMRLMNTCDRGLYKKSPLHYAAQNGDYNTAEFLLENGASTKTENTDGYVPLFEVIYNGHDKLLRLFKNYGVNLDSPIKYKLYEEDTLLIRPLFLAIKLNKIKIIDTLCQLDVNVNVCADDPSPPIFYMIAHDTGQLDIAKLLIEKYKAHVDCLFTQFSGAIRPIHFAICKGKSHLFDYLIEHSNPNRLEETISPFSFAIIFSQFALAKKLIVRGAIPTHNDFNLMLSFKNNKQDILDMIELVINHPEFSLQEYCEHFGNPLLKAILEDNVQLVKLVLTKYTFDLYHNNSDKHYFFRALILNRVDILNVFFNHLNKNPRNNREIKSLIELAYTSTLLEESDYKIIQLLYKESITICLDSKIPLPNTPTTDESSETSHQHGFFSHQPTKNLSSHAYLKLEKKLSYDEIMKYKEEIRLKKKNMTTNISSTKQEETLKEFTWFDGAIHSSLVQPIEKSLTGTHYLWLALDELTNQGCLDLDVFCKDRYTFSEQCVKALTGSKYNRQFQMNDETCIINATHELKIKNSADRILLFPVQSDDTSAVLYIGVVYKKDGFHVQKDKKILQHEQMERMSVITIKLPKELKKQEIHTVQSNACNC